MSTWHSGTIQANGIRLHFTRTGGGKPALVLVHGVSDDGLCWTPLAQVFAPDYDVIMLDARGHGQSDDPDSGYDLVTLAGDLHGAMQGLGLARPLVLGHSLGAVTTLVMAGLYPATPRAIVLEDPPAWWIRSPGPEFVRRTGQIEAWALRLKSQTREELIADGRADNPRWSEAELAPWADAKLRFSMNAIRNLFTLNRLGGIVWDELLPCVTCPVLALMADPERSALLASAGVDRLRALVPHVRVESIAGAGHNIHREQFDRYVEVVRAFLSSSS